MTDEPTEFYEVDLTDTSNHFMDELLDAKEIMVNRFKNPTETLWDEMDPDTFEEVIDSDDLNHFVFLEDNEGIPPNAGSSE